MLCPVELRIAAACGLTRSFEEWLYEQFRDDRSWGEITRDILTAEGELRFSQSVSAESALVKQPGWQARPIENPGFGHHWITVKLVGSQSNKSAIGARIHVTIIEQGKRRSIYRSVNSGGSFGCNPLRQNIGLGNAGKIESIEIYWPTSDLTQTSQDVPMDRAIQLVEGDEAYTTLPLKSFTLGGRSLAVTPLQH